MTLLAGGLILLSVVLVVGIVWLARRLVGSRYSE
jgi:hypothetical protein